MGLFYKCSSLNNIIAKPDIVRLIQYILPVLFGILDQHLRFSPTQVAGERYVYKFVCDPEALFSMAFPDNQRPSLKADPDGMQVPEDDTVPLSHYDETSRASYVDGRAVFP